MFHKFIQDPTEYATQKAALLYFQGPGVVKLLAADDRKQILTLEYISAHSLQDLFPQEDEQSTQLVCQVIDQLHAISKPTDFSFLDLSDWCSTLQKPHALPTDLLTLAAKKAVKLLATTQRKVLLHGDLHHTNILLKDNQPIVIDPKAVWGDPLFEPARFILNPINIVLQGPKLAEILQKRFQFFREHFNDRDNRIQDWTFVCAMIAACWNDDDGFDPAAWIARAEMLK